MYKRIILPLPSIWGGTETRNHIWWDIALDETAERFLPPDPILNFCIMQNAK